MDFTVGVDGDIVCSHVLNVEGRCEKSELLGIVGVGLPYIFYQGSYLVACVFIYYNVNLADGRWCVVGGFKSQNNVDVIIFGAGS